jgi:hypothetical protein
MPEDFLPPQHDGNPLQGDLLEQLLVVAAEKAARNEADNALRKGFVTREQINLALDAMGQRLENSIVEKITAAIDTQVASKVSSTLEATAGMRKSTVQTPEDEREADPVKYILKKSREQGAEALDDDEKRIVWGLTFAALAPGLKEVDGEDE